MLRNAANDGDIPSILELGILYMHGSHVNQDTEQAAKWFRKASDAGDPEAQYLRSQFSYLKACGHRLTLL